MRAIDKIINVKVRGDHLTKDNRNAGVQHEANVTHLRIDFDEGWDPYAKTVTFWDALMGNPTKLVMTTDKLEDIHVSHRVYLVPIPGEALGEPGEMTFVVDGYVDGKRKRSLADTLYVKEAPFEEEAGEPTDPTPSQAEQMQVQLDLIISDIQKAEIAAAEAQSNADFSLLQARTAGENAQDAMNQAITAGNHRRAAEAAQTAAENAAETAASDVGRLLDSKVDEAEAAQAAAAKSAEAAAKSASEAKQAAGGEWATSAEVDNKIDTHNTSADAHAELMQKRVEKTGDTMTGILTFDTPGLFSAIQKKRTIGGVNYIMRTGIGNDGNGASVCLRLFSVAADGTETAVSHIEADSKGVYWVSPGGIRKTIAHSGNIGVLSAGVE